jgi:hypothetical protein
MGEKLAVRELLYEETLTMTGSTDFGIDMESALSGATPIPPEGVRIDVAFAGELTGPKLAGKILGTDYVLLRGDGVIKLDVRAVIDTTDGQRIAFRADGVSNVTGGKATLRENVALHTASPRYAWVNKAQFWATGETDLATGKGTLKGYLA